MESFEGLLTGYVFLNHCCVECGARGALFATPRMFSACPKCLAERIRRLRRSTSHLPDWVLYLGGAAEREVAHQAERERKALSVNLDDFYKCAACGKLIQARDARYRIDPVTNSSPPYCIECHATGRVG